MGVEKDYSIEDIWAASTEKLYDIMASCGSPGYYQMAVEELQRRFLQDIASQTRNLTESSKRVEAETKSLEGSVTAVDASIRRLADSSEKMERLTNWITWLTVALFLLTLVQVALILKDQFSSRPVPRVQPAVQETQPEPPRTVPQK